MCFQAPEAGCESMGVDGAFCAPWCHSRGRILVLRPGRKCGKACGPQPDAWVIHMSQRPAGLRALNSNNPILRLSPWLCAPLDRPTALLFLSWLSSAQRLQICAFQKAGSSIRRERASVDSSVSWRGSPPETLPGESGTNLKLGNLHTSENRRHSSCDQGT